ncbi:MAG: iron-sulfur cluster assembly scaffold protein [Proteobacteria bacterium]|nr:iron-sulfur cluster assembly scaffold protein [Pseudomonadota bacterium]
MIDDIYNKEVLRLAADISRTEPLEAPDVTVDAASPLCGSSITVDLSVTDGKITNYAHRLKACALGQASASVMAVVAIGLDRAEIERVRDQVEAMLKQGDAPPDGIWAPLKALAPAKDAAARHGAILLPFRAVLEAWDQIDQAGKADAAE